MDIWVVTYIFKSEVVISAVIFICVYMWTQLNCFTFFLAVEKSISSDFNKLNLFTCSRERENVLRVTWKRFSALISNTFRSKYQNQIKIFLELLHKILNNLTIYFTKLNTCFSGKFHLNVLVLVFNSVWTRIPHCLFTKIILRSLPTALTSKTHKVNTVFWLFNFCSTAVDL